MPKVIEGKINHELEYYKIMIGGIFKIHNMDLALEEYLPSLINLPNKIYNFFAILKVFFLIKWIYTPTTFMVETHVIKK